MGIQIGPKNIVKVVIGPFKGFKSFKLSFNYVGCDNLDPKRSKKLITSIVIIYSYTFQSQH